MKELNKRLQGLNIDFDNYYSISMRFKKISLQGEINSSTIEEAKLLNIDLYTDWSGWKHGSNDHIEITLTLTQ